ncbi:DUF222 domain-containing protein [Aeromicrobium sp.]|uniref:HNH endonuclease n=1 Tax=Aeromicrobium sp. TaxID=1871063 RepID=UPI0030C1BB18
MDTELVIEAMRTTVRVLRTGDARDRVRAIQTAQDALDAAKAECLAELEVSRDYEIDGASTLNTWVRNELRLSAKDANALTRAAATLAQLPAVAHAAAAGVIRADHVAVFTYGLKHIDADIVAAAQPWLLDVARSHEPVELHRVMRALRDAIFPDDLDQAWMNGMDKQDIQVNPVPGGYHLTGFLNITTGTAFKKVLDSVSAPHDKDDTRPGSERRVQGLDDLMTDILQSGLPADKGVRPHLSVIVDADTLDAGTTGVPAKLAGYGSIGPKTLALITCGADLTPILTRTGSPTGQSQILNVGRSHRSPTLKQRRAVIARQGGVCAAPGCQHTHLEIHHTIWWSKGGPTDLDLLIGLCVRCHHLHHRGMLLITGNAVRGFTFTDRDNRPLLAAYRQRRAQFHENYLIRRTAAGIRQRRQSRLTA